ncbi:XRE family transcriptional regulator [Macrococcoides goetzii]|nr:helix-turn-helix transcriptional regulator [Macrococcus goetzii]TDM49955.1 XRE family transcriptional regulator [Macrococcus goetzii]
MFKSIQRHRERTNRTQEQVADMLLTTKPNICNIEKGRRNISSEILMTSYERSDDPILIKEMSYEFSNGYTTPAPSEVVFDDHRICIKERLIREINEVLDVLQRTRIDKRPEYCTKEELESIVRTISETYDVLFEGQAYIDKAMIDYHLNPQDLTRTRNQRYKMERRI